MAYANRVLKMQRLAAAENVAASPAPIPEAPEAIEPIKPAPKPKKKRAKKGSVKK